MAQRSDDRSLGELFAELSRETGVLVRKEVELATTEMSAKLKSAGGHAGIIAAGGALAHAALATQGMSRMRAINFAPRQTIDTLKETASWTSRTRA